jgi:hypothetical protein
MMFPNSALCVAMAVTCTSFAACGRAHTVAELSKVTRVEITDRNTRVLKRIEDKGEIFRIVSFVNQHRKGWTAPTTGLPIPRVHADLYEGPTFVAGFGVGRGFFETHRDGIFLSKNASESDQKKFLELIGLSPSILDE